MVQAIPIIAIIVSAFKTFSRAKKTIKIAKFVDDLPSTITAHQEALSEANKEEMSNDLDDINNFAAAQKPAESTATTLPGFMAENIAHSSYQSELLQKSIESQAKLNANVKMMSDTLNSTLPAMVVQMQEMAKIASVLSLKTEIETAYAEQALTNHEELISTLKNLEIISSFAENAVNVIVPDIVVETPTVTVASDTAAVEALTQATREQQEALVKELRAMNLTAFYEEGVLNVTNEVAAPIVHVAAPSVSVPNEAIKVEATVSENAVNVTATTDTAALNSLTQATTKISEKLEAVSANALKQKEIADYQTTATAIKNLDGNTIATAKPMEIRAIKDAVNAKNETDEMEFELDDDVLDNVFDTLPFPTFTKADVVQDDKIIYDKWSVNNG